MSGSANDVDEKLAAAARKGFQTPFDGALLILTDEGGAIWVDGASTPPAISKTPPTEQEPDCVWRGGRDTVLRALESDRAFDSAFVAGRLKISGDMSVMTRLELGPPS